MHACMHACMHTYINTCIHIYIYIFDTQTDKWNVYLVHPCEGITLFANKTNLYIKHTQVNLYYTTENLF